MTFYKRLNELQLCIVENDELLRDSMVLFFRTKGCHVQAFGNAEEASPVMESRPPDIVICDHGLPGMDGITFLSGLGARHPAVVKILIGGGPGAFLPVDAKRAGIDEVLLKPFSVDEIERAMERQLPRIDRGMPTTGTGRISDEEIA